MRPSVVILQAPRSAHFPSRYLYYVAISNTDQTMLLANRSRVALPSLKLRLNKFTLIIFPDNFSLTIHNQPALLLLIMNLERQTAASIDMLDFPHIGRVFSNPMKLIAPWFFNSFYIG